MASTIPADQVRARLTNKLMDVWVERLKPTTFLGNWFPDTPATPTRYLKIEVVRGDEKIAVDVVRDGEANHNKFSTSTEKTFDPPYFDEDFGTNSIDLYDRLVGSDRIDAGVLSYVMQQITMKMETITDKIERRYELMRAQALLTGIVTVEANTNIDFKRKSELVIAYTSGNNFADNAVKPGTVLSGFGTLLRKTGKVGGGTTDIIFGTEAWTAFINNTNVKEDADIRRRELEKIVAPTFTTDGASYHGTYSDGLHNYNLWTYEQFYKDASGTLQPYIDPKKIILLPVNQTRFNMAYAGVPQLIDAQNPTVRTGKFIYYDYTDMKRKSHIYGAQSAGMPMLTSVDKVLTAKVIAG